MRRTTALVLAALCCAASAGADEASPGPAVPTASGPDKAELAARIDGLFTGLMATHRIPGAVLVVVRGGEVVIAGGYGTANLETGEPVDPERTGFRVASISKLFTATAALQQVERGNLSLDTDVNEFLEGVEIEEAYGAPVTLRHLLTHTGGFDDRHLGTAQPLEASPVALRDYLAARMPPRVMPPGPILSYSNHGLALAGLLVEQASGVPFEEYVRREILEPLGMTRSRFGVAYPVPETMSRGYAWRGSRHADLGFDRLKDGPAGDLVTTGTDLARFMLAHLAGGEHDGVRILRAETAREMHREQMTMAPGLPGWALGFAVDDYRGVRGLAHGGGWRGFGSHLVLVPEHDVGWFFSSNHDPHPRFLLAARDGLWDALVPTPAPALPKAGGVDGDDDLLGSYVPNRRARGSFMKLVMLLEEVRVARDAGGGLVLRAPGPLLGGAQLRPLGQDRYAFEKAGVAFARDADGNVEHLFVDNQAYDRVAWSPRNHVLVAVACTLLFLGTLLGFALGGLARALAGGGSSPVALRARLLACGIAAAWLAWLVAVGVPLADPNIWELMVAIPAHLRALTWLPVVALPAGLWLAVEAGRGATVRAGAPLARLHLWLLVVASPVLFAGAVYWNLAGWQL